MELILERPSVRGAKQVAVTSDGDRQRIFAPASREQPV